MLRRFGFTVGRDILHLINDASGFLALHAMCGEVTLAWGSKNLAL